MNDDLNLDDNTEFDQAFGEATGKAPVDDLNEPDQTLEEPESQEEAEEPAQQKSTDEIIAELERERDDWRHQFQSNNGRISSYQRQVQELQNQINEQKSNLTNKQQQQLQQSLDDDDWEQIKEDFPEIASAMDKRLKMQLKAELDATLSVRLGELDKRLQPIESQAQQQVIRNEYAALAAEHPDYVDVARSEDFQRWMQTQPQPVKQLYNSKAASDAAYLLTTYKAMTGRNKPSPTTGIQQDRRAKLAQSVSVPNKRVARQPVADDDFEAAWAAATANK